MLPIQRSAVLCWAVLFLVVLSVQGCKTTDNSIKPGDSMPLQPVVYKTVSDAENQKAKDKLQQILSCTSQSGECQSLLPSLGICGPYLWAKIKDHDRVSKINAGNMTTKSPQLDNQGKVTKVIEMEGKLFQSSDEVQSFWKATADRLQFNSTNTIRKLNDEEKQIYWSMIPFKQISEPIFMVEGSGYKLLVNMVENNGDYSPFWVDDYYMLHRIDTTAQ
jgi:hypothetical protein